MVADAIEDAKTPVSVKKTGAIETSAKATREPVQRLCFICDQPGHLANACPTRSKPIANEYTTPVTKIARSFRKVDGVDQRAEVACCVGSAGTEPGILVQVSMDSFSDLNLVPSQWLSQQQCHGIEAVGLEVPVCIQSGIGTAQVVATQVVELEVRVNGLPGPELVKPVVFHVIEGSGESLTLGWASMRQFGVAAHLEALVPARRPVGTTMADATPVKEAEHEVEKSQLERVVEPTEVQVELMLVQPECELVIAETNRGTVLEEPNSVKLARVDQTGGLNGVSSSEQNQAAGTASRVPKSHSAGDADAEAGCQLGCDGEQCEQCERGVRPSWDPGDRVSRLAPRRDCQALTGRKTLGAM